MKSLSKFAVIYLALTIMACGSVKDIPNSGGNDFVFPEKADGMARNISIGDTVKGFVGKKSFMLYKLDLDSEMLFQVELTRTSGNIQPQGYLYQSLTHLGEKYSYQSPMPGFSIGDGTLKIEWKISQPGKYFLVVKSYGTKLSGDYKLTINSDTDIDIEPTNFLSEEEEKSVARNINNICGDTFCEGEFDWQVHSVNCNAISGTCDIRFDVQSYYDETLWEKDELDGIDESKRTFSGNGDNGPFTAKALEIVTKDSSESKYWMRTSCELEGNYKQLSDLTNESDYSFCNLTEPFYFHILDCVNELEKFLWKTLDAREEG